MDICRKKTQSNLSLLINRIYHSSKLDVFRGAGCGTERYLMGADVRARLSVSKWEMKKFKWKD
jgi:hypothetical protein